MKHLFIPYELAIIAKEKGFDEPCFTWYLRNKKIQFGLSDDTGIDTFKNSQATCHNPLLAAPLYQQIVDWFREKHGIEIQAFQLSKTQAAYGITFIETYPEKYNEKDMFEYTNTTQIMNEIELKEKRGIKIPCAKEIAKENYTIEEALNKAIEEAFKLI